MNLRRRLFAGPDVLAPVAGTFAATPKSNPRLDREVATTLRHLVNSNPTPRELNSKALAVLIFPEGNQTTVVVHRSGG
jgi:hypothetical protein